MEDLEPGYEHGLQQIDSRERHPLAAEEWLASRILECIGSPPAICRLALLNKNFSAASVSDTVWQKLLPPPSILNPLLPHLNFEPLTKKYLFISLCKSITYDEGLKKFWLDPATGGECHMISARALSIIWEDTPQYWQWKPYPGSMFAEVACLHRVCWFEVNGTFLNVFRPGRYVISFRLQLHLIQGWQGVPVKLSVQNATHAHPPHQSQVFFDNPPFKVRPCHSSSMFATFDTLSERGGKRTGKKQGEKGDERGGGGAKEEAQPSCAHGLQQIGGVDNQEGNQGRGSGFFRRWRVLGSRGQLNRHLGSFSETNNEDSNRTQTREGFHAPKTNDSNVWVECDVGEFLVEDDNENCPIEVKFSMKEIEVGLWKGGLFLDGAIIRPSYVIDNIDNAR